jgi:hypothetical protein
MSGKGYHLAIRPEEARLLLRDGPDAALQALDKLREQMERSTPECIHGYYKDWDVLHRCLSDGTFNPDGGVYPLNQCFICATLLCTEGAIVNLVRAETVPDVADSLQNLPKEDFVARFLVQSGLEFTEATFQQEFEGYYQKLTALGEFYRRAADGGRAILFFTDDCLSYFQ